MNDPSRFLIALFTLVFSLQAALAARVLPVPAPTELLSSDFTVEVNGQPADVVHAAASYDYVSVESEGPVSISITAKEDGFWSKGVDIQPWRLGIRPTRIGNTIQFTLVDPAKLSISRPGDFLNHARMLFFFVAKPAAVPEKSITSLPSYHYIAPGVYRNSLNPKSGETYFLAPGAVIFGSVNLWKVENVKILGRGVVVYQGTQNPNNDDGWMQRPDWHCIGAMEAHHIEIDGLTCLVRSRTWSIQMKDSRDFVYDDLRVIGGNPGNANQDGMDWLGGGDTVVRNSFFRASDDVLSVEGNWDGYEHEAMIAPGHEVSNILVEHSELSTSISNIVRSGWPEKTFNSHNFTLRDSDVLHSGIGSCGPPFALFTFWGARGAKGRHSNYTFENLWLDDWYSLFQIEQEQPALQGFTFRNIWALGQPPLVPSMIEGQVKDVRLENVKIGQTVATPDNGVEVKVLENAAEPAFSAGDQKVKAAFRIEPAILQPGTPATFTAEKASAPSARYIWLFGDGTTAQGRQVRHTFSDALGTQLDGTDANGSGRYRVLLHVESPSGNLDRPQQDWAEQEVVVVGRWHEAVRAAATEPGLEFSAFPLPDPASWPETPALIAEKPTRSGVVPDLQAASADTPAPFAIAYDGFLQVPAGGGYSFQLLARDGARLLIDGQPIAETGPQFSEVCGSTLNSMRYARGSIGLRAGKHAFRLETQETKSAEAPRLLWQGPGISLAAVPASAFSHPDR